MHFMDKRKIGFKTFYGGVCMPRVYCGRCKTTCFVIDGQRACCDEPVVEIRTEKKVRMSDGLSNRNRFSKSQIAALIALQDNRCAYCLYRFNSWQINQQTRKRLKLKIHIDHMIPWSYLATNEGELVAACQICNSLKSNRVFDDFDSIRIFLREERWKHGWENNGLSNVVWNLVRKNLHPRGGGNYSTPT